MKLTYTNEAVSIVVTDDDVQVSVTGSQSVGLRIPRKNFARFVELLYKLQGLIEARL